MDKEARANGVTASEQDLYELNARNIITLWGDKESGLREYSCRQWSGLIAGYYKPRWELFFHELNESLLSGKDPDWKAFDAAVKNLEWKWVNSHDRYDDQKKGDAVLVAVELYNKYRKNL